MRKYLKEHFEKKKGFGQIRSEASFVIKLQDGTVSHQFTIKLTPECNLYTQFMVGGPISKEVFQFIQKYDHDMVDGIYIPERDRFLMLVVENLVHYVGFSPYVPMTLSLYQAEKVIKQLLELKKIYPKRLEPLAKPFVPMAKLVTKPVAKPVSKPSETNKITILKKDQTPLFDPTHLFMKDISFVQSPFGQDIPLDNDSCVINPQS